MEKAIALAVVGVIVAWGLVPIAVGIFQIMRLRLHRAEMLPWHEVAGQAIDLAPSHAAFLKEVESLGFEVRAQGYFRQGPAKVAIAWLSEPSGLTHCGVSFIPSLDTAYHATFYSMDSGANLIATTNRSDWLGPLRTDQTSQVRYVRANAPNLSAHLAQHRTTTQAALVSEPESVYERACLANDHSFDDLLRRKVVVKGREGWHVAFNAAFEVVFQLRHGRAARGKTPYESMAFDGEQRADWLVQLWRYTGQQQAQHAKRHDLRATFLVASLLVSMALWGAMFNLHDAVAIAIVLLVHESGHALAMRWLGWRDVSMFFVPLFGALATGRATRPAAWKQVIVLLAGPLPGLVAGAAALWVVKADPSAVPVEWLAFTVKLATLAVVINLLNLLPLSPLDGGRLVELSLFTRWPRARVAFLSMGSAALAVGAFVWRDGVMGVLALLLLVWLPTQWRIARLQGDRDPAEGDEQALLSLSTSTVAHFPAQPLARQYVIFSGALNAVKLARPARWESAMALGLLLLVWGLAGPVAFRDVMQARSSGEHDTRTAAQKAFDDGLDEAEADESEGPQSKPWTAVRELESRLSADDPRHVDLQVNEAMRLSEPQRGERIERLIVEGRDGVRWSAAGLLTMQLSQAEAHARQAPLEQRLALLDDALDWATRVSPTRLAPTIDTRLRRAEVLDQLGREDETVASLDELRRRAAAADDCRCAIHEVVRAQAWHRVEHDDAKGAVALIDDASAAVSPSDRRALVRDRAWALLLDGQTQPGLAQMKDAVPTEGGRAATLDLVFALDKAGQEAQARDLAANLDEWECQARLPGPNADARSAPWQRQREAALTATAQHHCPDENDRKQASRGR